MKKRDLILIAALIITSAAFLIPVRAEGGRGYAYVYVEGELYGRYDMGEDRLITIDKGAGQVNVLEISDRSIRMKSATCPGRQCVNTGPISMNNDTICCAPSGILVIIRSDEDTGYDAITK